MGTKRSELVSGCFASAAQDEPVFVLRAQDATAPDFVRAWAQRYRQLHGESVMGWTDPKKKAKYEDAMKCADAMEAWPTRKLPD